MRPIHLLALGTLGLVTAWLVACASSRPENEVSTGLSTLMDPAAADPSLPAPREPEAPPIVEDVWAQAALDLERLLASTAAPSEASATEAMIGAAPSEPGSGTEILADASLSALASEPTDQGGGWLIDRMLDPARAMVARASVPVTTLAGVLNPSRNEALARSLAEAAEDSPRRRAEAASSDLVDALASSLDDVGGFRALWLMRAIEGAGLAAPDAETKTDARAELDPDRARLLDLLAALAIEASDDASIDVPSRLRAAAEEIEGDPRLRVTLATICRRVMGFGRYTPFESDHFVAGRPQRVIVYVEVDRFAHRDQGSAAAGERWLVELEQELILYDDPGSVAWRVPAQIVREASRSRRRDFYLIHEIELPATLAPGSYRLKVAMRDAATGAASEAVIPIRLVAASR